MAPWLAVLATVLWSVFSFQDGVLIGLRESVWVLFENFTYNGVTRQRPILGPQVGGVTLHADLPLHRLELGEPQFTKAQCINPHFSRWIIRVVPFDDMQLELAGRRGPTAQHAR